MNIKIKKKANPLRILIQTKKKKKKNVNREEKVIWIYLKGKNDGWEVY